MEGFGLKNGHYKHDEPFGHQSIDLGAVYYLASSAPASRESALVFVFVIRGVCGGGPDRLPARAGYSGEGRLDSFGLRTRRLRRLSSAHARSDLNRARVLARFSDSLPSLSS